MNKFIIKGGLALLVVALAATQVLAAGIVLKIAQNGLQDFGGTAFDPTYTGPSTANTANVEFFTGSIPGPLATTNRIAPGYTWLAGSLVHQYDDTSVNGGNVYIRSWSGSPRTQGSYYGKSSAYAAASGAQPALQYNVTTFKTDFLADAPKNAPTITSVAESNVRIGDTSEVVLKLTINYTYNQGSPKIEATGYDVKFWIGSESEPADSDATRVYSTTGTSFSLPDKDAKTDKAFGAGTYYFKVRAKNWFGTGPWSATRTWVTLSGGGGALSFTLDFFGAKDSLLIVNTVAVPSNTLTSPVSATVTTGKQLGDTINAAAGEKIVRAVCYWDPTTGLSQAVLFDESGNLKSPDTISVKPGVGYQVYTTKDLKGIVFQGQ